MRFLSFLLIILVLGEAQSTAAPVIVRVGHFPNLTHAQALIGHSGTRANSGWFEKRMGPDIQVQWFVYNAGPTAMEALLAGSIDLAYVGPNPAVNAHVRSRGQEIRIIAGACSGGAALLVQPDGRIRTDADFKGKKIATPQFGNTQDVAARSWLRSKGFRVTMTGGDVLVIPTSNPDQLALFKKAEIDGAWTIEPWVSRLQLEANAKIYLSESDAWPETGGRYITTHLVTSVRFLQAHTDTAKKWIAAHLDLTDWITQNPAKAQHLVNDELKAETSRPLPQAVLQTAWPRLEFTIDPITPSVLKSADSAHRIGFFRQKPDLSQLYNLTLLNQVLRDRGLKELPE